MSEWQPIATASKDEDGMLLYRDGDGGVSFGFWDVIEQTWRAAETQGLTGGVMEPTHWMPLPDPPQVQS